MSPTKGSKAAADIAALLRARNPLIWITTKEEARTERLLMESAQAAQYEPRFWDCSSGITDFAGTPKEAGNACTDPAQVLATIRDSTRRIDSARFSFLDLDESTEIDAQAPAVRGIDYEPAPEVKAAPAANYALEF